MVMNSSFARNVEPVVYLVSCTLVLQRLLTICGGKLAFAYHRHPLQYDGYSCHVRFCADRQ